MLVMIGLLVFAPGVLGAEITAGATGELKTGEDITDWLRNQTDKEIIITFVADLVLSEPGPTDKPTNRIIIDKSDTEVTFTSTQGQSCSIIRGEHLTSKPMIEIQNGTLELKSITIDGGGEGRSAIECGIDVRPTGSLIMNTGTTVKNHHITASNGSIRNQGSFTMEGGLITDNQVTYGGGVYNIEGVFTMRGGTISGNTATKGGGGVYNKSPGKNGHSGLIMTDGTIEENTAANGGGIFNDVNIVGPNNSVIGTVSIEGGSITNNKAAATSGGSGGGIYNLGILSIKNSTLSGNKALEEQSPKSTSAGGGIYNRGDTNTSSLDNGTVTLADCELENNEANFSGGGIHTKAGKVVINTSSLNGNSSDTQGGGMANDGGTLEATGCTISSNVSQKGGGLYTNSLDTLKETTFTGNTGTDAGAIFCANDLSGVPTNILRIIGGEITGNTGTRTGGVYLTNSCMALDGCTIKDNKLVSPPGDDPTAQDILGDSASFARLENSQGIKTPLLLGSSNQAGVCFYPNGSGDDHAPFTIEGSLQSESAIFLQDDLRFKADYQIAKESSGTASADNAGRFMLVKNGEDYYSVVPSTEAGKADAYILAKNATVQVTKDGEPWSGKTLYLYQGEDKKGEGTTSSTGLCVFFNAAAGAYQVHDDFGDTGVAVDLNGASADYNKALAYTSVSFSAAGAGFTQDPAVSATCNGEIFLSGDGILVQRELILQASHKTASGITHKYLWSEASTAALGEDQTLRAANLDSARSYSCLISGYGSYSVTKDFDIITGFAKATDCIIAAPYSEISGLSFGGAAVQLEANPAAGSRTMKAADGRIMGTVRPDNSGHTAITLTADFLDTLAPKDYPLTVDFTYGTANTALKLNRPLPVIKAAVFMDGLPWTVGGQKIALFKDGVEIAAKLTDSKGECLFSDLQLGSYTLHDPDGDTGEAILLDGGEPVYTRTLSYFTVKYQGLHKGLADKATITATSGGKAFASGQAVLSTRPLELSASATGSAEWYDYLWQDETGNVLSQAADFSPPGLGAGQTYTCTVTGMCTYPTTKDFEDVVAAGRDAICIFGGPFADLIGIDINGMAQELVRESAAEVGIYHRDSAGTKVKIGNARPGSTVVTLYAAYLDTLPNGVYEVKAYFKEGVAKSSLTIGRQAPKPAPTPGPTPTIPGMTAPAKGNPLTGDAGNLGTWCVLLGLSVVAILMLKRKGKFVNN